MQGKILFIALLCITSGYFAIQFGMNDLDKFRLPRILRLALLCNLLACRPIEGNRKFSIHFVALWETSLITAMKFGNNVHKWKDEKSTPKSSRRGEMVFVCTCISFKLVMWLEQQAN